MTTGSPNQPVHGIGFQGTFLIGAALFGAIAVLAKPALLQDPDVYWHIAAGDWMLSHRQVLTHDVFSHTVGGKPWIAQEWLSEVLISLAYQAGGWSALKGLFCAVGALTAWLMARQLARSLTGISAIFVMTLGLVSASGSLLARPHILVVPILVLWTCELLNARATSRAPSWWMALLMLVWANMHGSFVLGFVLFGIFALEALIENLRTPGRVIFSWGAVGLLTFVAALASPLGFEGMLHPFDTMSLRDIRTIVEWQSPDFSQSLPFELALLTVVAFSLHRGMTAPIVRVALLVLLLHMALQHQRHILVLALVAPLVLAEPVARSLGQTVASTPGRLLTTTAIPVALVVLVIALVVALPGESPPDTYTPKAAVDHVPPSLAARPVLNDYDFGGYLIFRGIKTYIDGRADLYGSAYLETYLKARRGDSVAIDSILQESRIDWTITRPGDTMALQFDRWPGWKRIYADKQAVVHARIGAPGVP